MEDRSLNVALQVATSLCKRFEGLRLKPYLCPAGIPTIGYGSTYYENGKQVTLKDPPITEALAEALLEFTILKIYMPGVKAACPALTGEALGAMTDFAYNLGVTRFKSSTLAKKINAQDWAGARVELAKWDKGGGRVLKGLTIRRAAESVYLPKT